MLNKDQEKNRVRQTENKKYKTLIKKQFKKITNYLKEDDWLPQELKAAITETQKILDKAASKRIIHKNKAARKKSNLHKLFSSRYSGEKKIIN